MRCGTCHAERLVAFSCKRRGFCPSCGARRMAESAALLVDDVFPLQPVRQWVLSFPYPLRFLFATRPAVMGRVLGIVYRTIATHLIKKAGFTRRAAHTGAVMLFQQFGGALNLNVHLHMLFLDGVYVEGRDGLLRRFQWVKAPTSDELTRLSHTIARRVGRFLQRQGLLECDTEKSYLGADAVDDESMAHLQGHSITYRIAAPGILVLMSIVSTHTESIAFHAVVFFGLGGAHAGVRIGRKTHIVDLAGGDRKAEFVAESNTLIGVILLVLGASTGVFMEIGLEFAIAVLSAMSLLGAIARFTLRDVQA